MLMSTAGRWQFEIVSYNDTPPYPLLLLEPGADSAHQRIAAVLTGAGLAVLNPWEWRNGLWPLAVRCRVQAAADGTLLTVDAAGNKLFCVGAATSVPEEWLVAALHRRQVLFVLLPRSAATGAPDRVLDDVTRLDELAAQHWLLIGCTAATVT